jgi:hypothetical protein
MVRKITATLVFSMVAYQALAVAVSVETIVAAPESRFGNVFSYDDRLAYLSNGVLIYMGAVPANVYSVRNGRYVQLIGHYSNPVFDESDPDTIVSELLPSRVNDEFLYYVRARGAEQENYRILPTADGSVSIEIVGKAYWDQNQNRKVKRDLALLQGCRLELKTPDEMEGSGVVEPRIVRSDGSLAFALTSIFPGMMVNHFGQVAVSPDRTQIAMIVNYESGDVRRYQRRLVVLRIDYDL